MANPVRAVIAKAYGAPESFALETIDLPATGPNEVRVAIRAAGISFADLLVAKGAYQVRPPLPLIPGSEFAGHVEAVGADVGDFVPGDYVAGSRMTGALAEGVVIAADQLRRVAAHVPAAEAAVFSASFSTAWLALVERARMKAGETILVLGAGGAVGLAAVQLAKLLGGHVVASASSPAKRNAAAAAGADRLVDSGAEDWRACVQRALDGRTLDIVVDPVGGELTEAALRMLGWRGRHLVIGFAAGAIPKIATNLVLLKGISVIGVELRRFSELEAARARAASESLFDHLGAGRLKPLVAAQFPIDCFVEAMNLVLANSRPGRVVLRMS